MAVIRGQRLPRKPNPALPRVHNKYANSAPLDAVYIGRGSKWGNPFIIGTDGTRGEVCDKYEQWFNANRELRSSISELTGKHLICYCKPDRCHGDFLLNLANDVPW